MSFKPEFLNRLDEIVVFKQLTKPQVRRVADIMLKDVYGRMAAKGIAMTVTEQFKDKLLEQVPPPPLQGPQPLSPWRQVSGSMAFVADSNCPQSLRQLPPTALLTASGAATEVPPLPMHPCSGVCSMCSVLCWGAGMHWTEEGVPPLQPPPPLQGAQPMPSRCPRDGKCRL